VNNAEEVVAAIRKMEGLHQLYIVGRGYESGSPLTVGLQEWAECPELGPIGDVLVSSEFTKTVSVLVVQQYVIKGELTGAAAISAAHQTQRHSTASNANQRISMGLPPQRGAAAAFGISR
jgi:hypothetical protein